jgi:hypothetical protein
LVDSENENKEGKFFSYDRSWFSRFSNTEEIAVEEDKNLDDGKTEENENKEGKFFVTIGLTV